MFHHPRKRGCGLPLWDSEYSNLKPEESHCLLSSVKAQLLQWRDHAASQGKNMLHADKVKMDDALEKNYQINYKRIVASSPNIPPPSLNKYDLYVHAVDAAVAAMNGPAVRMGASRAR